MSLVSLPVSVIVKIIKMLFYTDDYGGQVDDRSFRQDVYSCFVAHPGLYQMVMTSPEMRRTVGEAKAEYELRMFYDNMMEEGGY